MDEESASRKLSENGRDEGQCPFCFEKNITEVTDCYDVHGKKICELWFCEDCGGFFPRMLSLKPDETAPSRKARVVAADDEDSEKRRSPRFPVQFVVQVSFDDGEAPSRKGGLFFRKKQERMSEPIVAMVMNAGMGGLCFRYPELIEEGREGRMKISLPSAQRSFTAVGKVVRSTQLPDGSYGLGVQFVEVDPDYRLALQRYITLE